MSSVLATVTAGNSYIRRTTNVPGAGGAAFTAIVFVKVDTYADFREFFALEGAANTYCLVESTSAGDVYLITRNGPGNVPQFSFLWSDGRTGWRVIAVRNDGTNAKAAHMAPGDAAYTEVSHAYNNGAVVATSVAFAGTPQLYPSDTSGLHDFGGIKIFNRLLSDAELLAEMRQRRPKSWNGLTFFNECLDSTLFAKDQSGTGGDFTATGGGNITTTAGDSGVAIHFARPLYDQAPGAAPAGGIAASLTAGASCSGTLGGNGSLASATSQGATMSAPLSGRGLVASGLSGGASLSAVFTGPNLAALLTASGVLAGTLRGIAPIAANCTAGAALSGSVSGRGTVAAALTASAVMAAPLSGRGSVAAGLFAGASAALNLRYATDPALRLSVPSSQHYVKDGNNNPFLINGHTAWGMAVQLSPSDVITYLDDIQSRGFNAIIVEAINVADGYVAGTAPANYNGDLPFVGGDFKVRVEAYWKHVDYIVAQASLRGIVVMLVAVYAGYGTSDGGAHPEGWYAQMIAAGATDMQNYGDFLGARYAHANNIVYVLGGDYRPTSLTLYNAVATGILGKDTGHLITTHWGRGSSGTDGSPTWLTLNTSYTDQGDVQSLIDTHYAISPTIPTFLIEARYKGTLSGQPTLNARDIRQQAWHAVLSGATGQFFGHHGIWYFPSGWQSDLSDDCRLPRMHQLLTSKKWYDLIPSTGATLITSGRGASGTANYVVGGITVDDKLAIIYMPHGSGNTINVDTNQLISPVKARWYDPTNGTFTTATGSPFNSAGTVAFTRPTTNGDGDADSVLILETDTGSIGANVAGGAALGGVLSGVGSLAASLTEGAAFTGNLAGAGALNASCSAGASVTAALGKLVTSSLTAGASVTAALGKLVASSLTAGAVCSGSLAGIGATAAALSGGAALAATAAGIGLVNSPLTGSASLVGSVAGTASLASALSGSANVSSSVAGQGAVSSAQTGSATLAGTLADGTGLSAALNGAATCTGSVTGRGTVAAGLSGGATCAATLGGATTMAAAASGGATLAATSSGVGSLAAAHAGSATLAASLGTTNSMAGPLVGGASCVGTLGANGSLSATLPASANVGTAFTGIGSCAAALSSGASALANLTAAASTISAALGGGASMAPSLLAQAALAAALNGHAACSGAFAQIANIVAGIGGSATCSGSLVSPRYYPATGIVARTNVASGAITRTNVASAIISKA